LDLLEYHKMLLHLPHSVAHDVDDVVSTFDDFQLHVDVDDVVCAEDFQLRADVDVMPALC
jgi:hypothetical protein